MAASWPPTSGATRISVARTTPTIGEAYLGRQRTYPPIPAAARMSPSAVMGMPVRLATPPPPLGKRGGNHRERKIDDRQGPQAAPVVRHLPQGCAELVDAENS